MTKWYCLAAGVTLFLLPQALWAQKEKPQRPDAAGLFDKLDKNGDGFVTKDEIPPERQGFFKRLLRADKNNDGRLTKDELAAGLAGGRKKRPGGEGRPQGENRRPDGRPNFNPEQLFKRLDTNGDGKITKADEPPERAQRLIGRADANKDGTVTKEEFTKATSRFPRPAQGDRRPGGGGSDGALFRALDVNGDGKISAEEMLRAAAALKKLDRNGDGSISRQELGGGRDRRPDAAQRRPDAAQRFKQLDKNGDGKITKGEAPERFKENFDRIDANNDGHIDLEEMRTAFSRRAKAKKRPNSGRDRKRPKRKKKA